VKKIPYVSLDYKKKSKFKLVKIFKNILDQGQFVGGQEILNFEKNISKLCKTKYCVALNSGTDALTLSLHILGVRKGDEVITTPNSFIASTAVIVHLGAIPVFVDVLDDQNIDPSKIERAITKKTKVIMPVHLSGKVSQMIKINKIAKKYNLKVVEDAAQAIASSYNGKMAGSMGDIGCFSAHPLKNLGAFGDAGYITTNNFKIYKKIKSLSNHGMENRNLIKNFGYVSRMDNLQAAFLNYKLKSLKKIINLRRRNASIYINILDKDFIKLPYETDKEYHTYHTFVIQVKKRDELKNFLSVNGIETSIHYPKPIHLQPASKKFGYKLGDFKTAEKQSKQILTLPINENLSILDIKKISNLVNYFVRKKS
jgi:dTDP-4-amino-4,6-dideoxygalactose transaminase